MNKVQRIWQKAAPEFLLVFIRLILAPKSYKQRRKAVLTHFKNVDQNTLPPEIQEGLRYLEWHKFTPYPYRWTWKYDSMLPEVFHDKTNQCYYILFDNKKMYFPKTFSLESVIWAVRLIKKEQDPLSPHLYLTDDFQPEPGSIVIDAGVAEGNFALSVIDKAKKIYLVECDKGWMEALKLTFAPWKDKVVFVEKFMSDELSDTTTTIDGLLDTEHGENLFIKLDIEGFEQKALSGMRRLVTSGKHIKMDVCTYHHPDDLIQIKAILKSFGFTCQVSDGYVLFFQSDEEPSFRKSVIRAEKR